MSCCWRIKNDADEMKAGINGPDAWGRGLMSVWNGWRGTAIFRGCCLWLRICYLTKLCVQINLRERWYILELVGNTVDFSWRRRVTSSGRFQVNAQQLRTYMGDTNSTSGILYRTCSKQRLMFWCLRVSISFRRKSNNDIIKLPSKAMYVDKVSSNSSLWNYLLESSWYMSITWNNKKWHIHNQESEYRFWKYL